MRFDTFSWLWSSLVYTHVRFVSPSGIPIYCLIDPSREARKVIPFVLIFLSMILTPLRSIFLALF